MQLSKFIKYSPFIFLILGFIFKIFITVKYPTYNYDENVIYEISNLEIKKLTNTVLAEPHPLGFYIYLHYMNKLFLDNRILIQIFTITLSFLLIFLTLIYAYKKNIIQRYKFNLGIAIFFSSYSYMITNLSVKQDILSFPIFFMVFLILINQPNKKFNYFLLTFLIWLLLLLGYIYYFSILLLTTIIFLLNYLQTKKMNKKIVIFLVTNILFLALYFYFYFFKQAINNLSRFEWTKLGLNSVLNSIHQSIFIAPNQTALDQIAVFIFIAFATLGLVFSFQIKTTKKTSLIFIYFLGFYLLGYLKDVFIAVRYTLPFFFILCIYWGWGVQFLFKKYHVNKLVIFFILCLFFSLGGYSTLMHKKNTQELDNFLKDTFNKTDKNYGVIWQHGIIFWIFNKNILQKENLEPINIYDPYIFKTNEINQNILKIDGKIFIEKKETEIINKLKIYNLTNYYYLISILNNYGLNTLYDPNKLLFDTLQKICKIDNIIIYKKINLIFDFTDCKF